jgi:hypothetical protein
MASELAHKEAALSACQMDLESTRHALLTEQLNATKQTLAKTEDTLEATQHQLTQLRMSQRGDREPGRSGRSSAPPTLDHPRKESASASSDDPVAIGMPSPAALARARDWSVAKSQNRPIYNRSNSIDDQDLRI